MANINIPNGRGIILSGNRQLAGQYVQIAKRRLHDLKQMMSLAGLEYGQRSFNVLRDCVWMRLWSIGNADFIRIHACAEGEEGCEVSFTTEQLSSTALSITIAYIGDDFVPPSDIRGYFVDWGDGLATNQFSSGPTKTFTHTYAVTGTYTITVSAWGNQGSGSPPPVTVQVDTGTERTFTTTGFNGQKFFAAAETASLSSNCVDIYADDVFIATSPVGFGRKYNLGLITSDTHIVEMRSNTGFPGCLSVGKIFYFKYTCLATSTQEFTFT